MCIRDSNTPAVWTELNALVADNVAQAAGATIRSLQRGVFAGMRALGLAGYRWALPRISSVYQCYNGHVDPEPICFQNLHGKLKQLTGHSAKMNVLRKRVYLLHIAISSNCEQMFTAILRNMKYNLLQFDYLLIRVQT